MNIKEISEEILYSCDLVTKIDLAAIKLLKTRAAGNRRKRVRICAHPDVGDALHEMLIVHTKGAYVRPHKHQNKSESFHIIEGKLAVIIFNEDGSVGEVIKMAGPESNEVFYYRLSASYFHTVIPLSDFVVFHETTNGPFKREETLFPVWAPPEEDTEASKRFLQNLMAKVNSLYHFSLTL